ncbi:LacI family transcriptional regulator [Roseibium denhamense]|uniref:LacI family transcriptional regulator n=1 Tax=Roseibium denhamense TaxID=76305 RepID=A0ABY1PMU3_9HYPH|nr:LacI family DNA-binding transcriptional regulator [Roseibium denhamense]MTI05727.1 LacI family transcriptional regulator [Roseibium denhamense]SMP36952.1 LacI family transcriptional regulator [Roseibium denhamense]
MTHRFPIKEIALQSGLSTATVDRVLNDRANVSPQTRRRVRDAIDELMRQEGQLAARGRRIFIDIIVEAPARFSREIEKAVHAGLSRLAPLAIRPRFSFFERLSPEACAAELRRVRKRGSQGVCLKAQDAGPVRDAIATLSGQNIPVVTVFTDCPGSARVAYAGLNNTRAGQTAAYLMDQWLDKNAQTVLTTLSQHSFQGEEERFQGFKTHLVERRPQIKLIDASGGGGLNMNTARKVADLVGSSQPVDGVYSMGGGNLAILDALQKAGQTPSVFIAHDLDEDNLGLLESRQLTIALYHDLQEDMLAAFRHILAFQGIGEPPALSQSDIQIVTPMNIPSSQEQAARVKRRAADTLPVPSQGKSP